MRVLPKHVKQMGETTSLHHIYIEDYVITYLNRLLVQQRENGYIVLFLGNEFSDNGEEYFMMSGALGIIKRNTREIENFLGEKDITEVKEKMEKYFPDLHIIGCGLIQPKEHRGKSISISQEQNEKIQEMFYGVGRCELFGHKAVLMKCDVDNLWEQLYLKDHECIEKVKGFSIYYEDNEQMQSYLIDWYEKQEAGDKEEEDGDRVHAIRETILEKRFERKHKGMASAAYVLCMGAVIVLCVSGISMVNQYDKMKQIEASLAELSKNVEGITIVDTIDTADEGSGKEVLEKDGGKTLGEEGAADKTGESEAGTQDISTGEKDVDSTTSGINTDTAETEESVEIIQVPDQEEVVSVFAPMKEVETAVDLEGAESSLNIQPNETSQEETTDASQKETTDASQEGSQADAEESMPETEQSAKDNAAVETEKKDVSVEAVDESAVEAAPVSSPINENSGKYYTVKEGDTLLQISKLFYGTTKMVPQICELNSIQNSDTILCGQKIVLP